MRNQLTQQRATDLRKQLTDAEQLLWMHLRKQRMLGFKFRRQVPIGPYIADFACLKIKLVIELDGGQHRKEQPYDRRRDAWLRREGFHVLRFWDNEMLMHTQAVLEAIWRALQATRPHPNPPP